MTHSTSATPTANFSARVALLTPPGRGAVATLLVVGNIDCLSDRDLFRAANGKPMNAQALNRIVYGHWVGSSNSADAEEIVLSRRAANEIEIHCHGGLAPSSRILQDLRSIGCEVLSWQELVLSREGSFAAESQEALASAPTLRTAAIIAAQVGGIFRSAVESLIARTHERSCDFHALRTELDQLLSRTNFGRHLTRPWQVVLTGRPNVGKSSLINALLGFTRSIVYDEPGTTRDVVTAITAFDGWPVELADTAGLRSSASGLEAAGIALAQQHLETADCRLLLLDQSTLLTDEDQALLQKWPDAILIAHKSDLPKKWNREQLSNTAISVSSRTGEGIDILIGAIVNRLVPTVPPANSPIPVTQRQIQLLTRAREAAEHGHLPETQKALHELI